MTREEVYQRARWLASQKRSKWKDKQMPKMTEDDLRLYRETFPGDMFTDWMLRGAWDDLVVCAKPW